MEARNRHIDITDETFMHHPIRKELQDDVTVLTNALSPVVSDIVKKRGLDPSKNDGFYLVEILIGAMNIVSRSRILKGNVKACLELVNHDKNTSLATAIMTLNIHKFMEVMAQLDSTIENDLVVKAMDEGKKVQA